MKPIHDMNHPAMMAGCGASQAGTAAPCRTSTNDLRAEAVRLLQDYSPDNAGRLLPVLAKLQQTCRQDAATSTAPLPQRSNGGGDNFAPLSRVVKEHVLRVYDAVGHNKTRAAKVLEIDIKTLYNKLKRYDNQ